MVLPPCSLGDRYSLSPIHDRIFGNSQIKDQTETSKLFVQFDYFLIEAEEWDDCRWGGELGDCIGGRVACRGRYHAF